MQEPPPLPERKVRYHDLDALRAFAMLLGLVLHGLLSFMPVPFWPAQDIHQNAELNGLIVSLIHGFRMPLFFLLSGFFMMMLWQKRGGGGLVSNRAVRILVPLAVGTVLINPLIGGIGIYGAAKKASAAEARKDSEAGQQVGKPRTIWQAAKFGDLELTQEFITEGAEVNDRDGTGISPLSWASMAGHPEVVSLLIEKGADVNSRDKENRIALHGAAFLGRVEVVKRLLAAGSEVNVIGSSNDTPLDSTHSDMGTVNWIAGMLSLSVDTEKVQSRRPEVRELLRAAGGKRAGQLDASQRKQSGGGKPAEDIKRGLQMLAFVPIFHHLWFLHYLIWFTVAFIVLASLAKVCRLKRLPGAILHPLVAFLWLVPLTACAQGLMENEEFGADTATGILIWPPIFFYYGIFVLYGALCFGREEFTRPPKFRYIGFFYFLAAIAVGLVALMPDEFGIHFGKDTREWLGPLLAACYSWLMSFSLIYLFRQFFTGESQKIRWLSDSAYWLYLAHLPLMMLLQILVSQWDFPWVLKFLIVVSVTTIVLLSLYQVMVRYTFIGAVLNGKKVRPGSGAQRQ